MVWSSAGEVDVREGCAPRAGLDLRDPQQRAEGIEDLVGLGDRLIDGGLVVGHGRRLGARELQALAQARERRAHVMGNVVGDLTQAVHQHLDAIEHLVEVGREAIELVAGAAQRDAAREVAAHDVAAGVGDGGDPPQHAGAGCKAADQGEGEGGRQTPGGDVEDQVLEVGELVGVLPDDEEPAVGQRLALGHQRVRAVGVVARPRRDR